MQCTNIHTYCTMLPIGLLQESGKICGMMTIINIVMMVMVNINFFGGMKIIKNERPKKLQ